MSEAIHPSIVTAICRVQASMGAVKKDQKNQHGNYMFASTDAIYAELTKRMAEAGLVIIPLEEEEPDLQRIEKDGKTAQWGKFVFSFVLATAEATWTSPTCRRTLMLQITGPQTFQAAQSYAEKAFLRSLFKLPTGDMDLDSTAQADAVEDQEALAGNGTKRKSSAAAKREGGTEKFNEIRKAISNAQSRNLLSQVRVLYAAEIAELPIRWAEMVEDEYDDRMAGLEARELAS